MCNVEEFRGVWEKFINGTLCPALRSTGQSRGGPAFAEAAGSGVGVGSEHKCPFVPCTTDHLSHLAAPRLIHILSSSWNVSGWSMDLRVGLNI